MTFSYEAKDTTGREISGLIDAGTAALAAAALHEQGLFPTRIVAARRPVGDETLEPAPPQRPGGGERIAPFLFEIPLPELAQMYRQLATLLRAGVPLVQTFTALTEQTRSARLQGILREAVATISGGEPFSAVMDRHPTVFTTLQRELIRAGELSGALETMCVRIADYLERELEIRRKLKRETLYPKIVLFIAGLVLLILGFVGAGMGAAGVDAVKARLLFAATVGGVALGVWWLARSLNQYPAFGALWDNVRMAIPGVGGVTRRYATARFCRALGTLYMSGVLLTRAVEIAARACGNRAIEQAMLAGVPGLMGGGGLSEMLARSGVLSATAVQMARTGEQTGSLDQMMDKVADTLESEADMKAHQLAVAAGVLALLVAATVVGIIAISFYGGYLGAVNRGAEG
jgi:type II secretory pathway component PulF